MSRNVARIEVTTARSLPGARTTIAVLERVLPRSTFGRVYNFMLFNVLERVFPGAESEEARAERSAAKRG